MTGVITVVMKTEAKTDHNDHYLEMIRSGVCRVGDELARLSKRPRSRYTAFCDTTNLPGKNSKRMGP